jgi:hypothetical protein
MTAPRSTRSTHPRREPVHLAPDAEPGRRGEERERRHDPAEDDAGRREAGGVGDARGGQEGDPDHVREARRARVLDRTLAQPGLDELEVQEAREAIPAAEGQADRQLQRDRGEEAPGPGEDREERQRPDDRLIGPRRAGVDDLGVAVRMRGPGEAGGAHVLS